MNKAEMRGAMKDLLAAMSPTELQDRSRRAAERFRQTGAWMWMDVLFCFLSMPGELATEGLISAARNDGKAVAVPCMEDRDIRFVMLPADAPEPPRDRWGIPVPDPAWPGVDLARAGRILVCAPGLAFDRQGNRLGRGRATTTDSSPARAPPGRAWWPSASALPGRSPRKCRTARRTSASTASLPRAKPCFSTTTA